MYSIEENEKLYGKEVREKYGDKVVDAANAKVSGMTQADIAAAEDLANQIKIHVLAGMSASGTDRDKHAKAAAQVHAKWLQYYWPKGLYTPEAHKLLAQGYIADERFKQYYDSWGSGACEFLVYAILKYI